MDPSTLNTVDLVVISVIALSGIFAFKRGLVREVFSLGSWIAAAYIAARYYQDIQPWMKEHYLKKDLAAQAASAVALFCGTLIVLIPIGNYLVGIIKGPTMTTLDRSLGFVFGLLRGALVLSLVYLCFLWAWPNKEEQPKWLSEAKTKPVLVYSAEVVKSFIPKDDQEKAAEEVLKSREAAEKAVEDAEHLDIISTPVPKADRDAEEGSPVYDNTNSERMDEIIDRNNE